jgi:hypothetical protein
MAEKSVVEKGKGRTKKFWIQFLLFAIALVAVVQGRIGLDQYDVELYPWSVGVNLWYAVLAIVLMIGVVGVVSSVVQFGSKDDLPTVEKSRLPAWLLSADLILIIFGVFAIVGFDTLLPASEQALSFYYFTVFLFVGLIVAGSGTLWAVLGAERREFVVPKNVLDSLQQVEPDKSFETKNFLVFKKGPIYILLKKMFNGAHFVRLLKETPVTNSKVRLPFLRSMIARRRATKFQVDDLDVLAVRGEFTIPINAVKHGDRTEEKYASGPGILYYAPVFLTVPAGYRSFRILDLSATLDKSAILKTIAKLSKEE